MIQLTKDRIVIEIACHNPAEYMGEIQQAILEVFKTLQFVNDEMYLDQAERRKYSVLAELLGHLMYTPDEMYSMDKGYEECLEKLKSKRDA